MTDLEKLKQLTAWDIAPEVTEDELEECLTGVALEDANGFAPNNEEWTPTYDINSAAARTWLIKAGRAAAIVDEPSAGAVTSKVFDNCREMARIFNRKQVRTAFSR